MYVKLLNPMAYVRWLRRLYSRLRSPAPLNDYPDYDEYWERRHASGTNPGLLHRYKAIAELLPADASVLDVGCGDGSFGMHLLQVRPDCAYFGVDISASAIAILTSRGLNGAVLKPSGRLRQQVEGHYDVVTAMEVLEHVPDAEEIMRDITEIARRAVIVTIPNSGFMLHRVRLAVFGRFPVTNIVFHMKEHVRFWTVRDFQEWSSLFGLTITRIIGQESAGSVVERNLARRCPALFAAQLIYVMDAAERVTGSMPEG